MRIFASERVSGLMQKLGMQEGEAIEHPWVNKAIENAQRKVEAHNFDIRKQLLEYDDVANDQRKVIYKQRNDLMAADDISETIDAIRPDVVSARYRPPISRPTVWKSSGMCLGWRAAGAGIRSATRYAQWLEAETNLHEERLRERILMRHRGYL